MTTTDGIGDTTMITATDATSDTAMPEGSVTPPMTTTPSWTDCVEATTGVVTRAADIGSGDNTPTRTAAVAPADKETAIAGAEPAGLPRGGIQSGRR